MKAFWLCADDYAQNAEISAGIRDLYAMKRVNAISCMTNMPLWAEEGCKLVDLHDGGYVGLHLNLTQGDALSSAWQKKYGQTFRSLGWVMTHRLSRDVLRAECQAQLTAFCQVMGRMPDFVDGHQHVHQFPQIADVMMSLLDVNQFRGMLRVSANPEWQKIFSLKGAVIALWGGWRLRRLLNTRSIACNTSFSGIYAFSDAQHYSDYFKSFLAHTVDQGLIMCHPGHPSLDKTDPLQHSRYHEYLYLSSDIFLSDLKQYGMVLKQKGQIHDSSK